MRAMAQIRVVDTGLADPAFTAAMDETFLEGAGPGTEPVLHLYMRDPPAVTLGYFLDAHENVDMEYCKARGISIVRRLSGGGAIYTDNGQLIYGLAGHDILPEANLEAFELVCGAIAKALGSLGCDCGHSPVNDVVANGRKLSGSAIHRSRGSMLMHGTVIVDIDREAMFRALRVSDERTRTKGHAVPGERVTSLNEVLGRKVPMEDVKTALVTALGHALGLAPVPSQPTGHEVQRAHGLVKERYGNETWNLKKNK